MKKILLVLSSIVLSLSVNAQEVSGVKLADNLQSGSSALVLNGAGLRKKLVFKVYVAALYLVQKQSDPATILLDNNPQRVELHMLRELSDDTLLNGLTEAIEDNATASEMIAISAPLKQMTDIFHQVKIAKVGDIITIDYAATSGSKIGVNGVVRGTIPGELFHRALLKIWLGNKPVQDDLKMSLLGG